MTCKTHTIINALRKLRDEGYRGKVNPAMIREITGIQRPGKIMCDLRQSGYLLDAGEIHLPAHRGKTLANQYTINPDSELMPKRQKNIADKKKKARLYTAEWQANQDRVEKRNSDISARLFSVICQKWPHTVSWRVCL